MSFDSKIHSLLDSSHSLVPLVELCLRSVLLGFDLKHLFFKIVPLTISNRGCLSQLTLNLINVSSHLRELLVHERELFDGLLILPN